MLFPTTCSSPLTTQRTSSVSPAAATAMARLEQDAVGPNATGDTVDISELGRTLTLGGGRTLMSATTDTGSTLTLESRQSMSSSGFVSGLAATYGGNGRLGRTGQFGGEMTPRTEYVATFTHSDGSTQSFVVDGTTRFYQQGNGAVMTDKEMGAGMGAEVEGQSIIVNVADGARVQGGKGNDLVLNVGRSAQIDTGDGGDQIISMGNGVAIDGGEGNDRISLLEDVLQRTTGEDGDTPRIVVPAFTAGGGNSDGVFDEVKKYIEKDGSVRKPADSLTASVDGGDGDDNIAIDAVLYEGDIRGGDGNDSIRADDVLLSRVDGGAGDDIMDMGLVVGSTILGGKGDDRISARLFKDSTVQAGEGNDVIRAKGMEGSFLQAGEGDDSIFIDDIRQSIVDGGAGNDLFSFSNASGSLISGGEGDDTFIVQPGSNGKAAGLVGTVLDGGEGNDTFELNLTSPDGKGNGVMRDSVIRGGGGNDTIRLTVDQLISGTGEAPVQDGEGNNSISITVGSQQ